MTKAFDLSRDFGLDYFVEVTPMLDEHWTGISMVNAGLADALLRAAPERTRFFVGADTVATGAVRDAIARSSGLYLRRDFLHGEACEEPLRPGGGPTLGIFPTVKSIRNAFTYECSIIHDVSTLITPQYHTLDNIDFHMGSILRDLASNSRTVCVSEATASDLLTYFAVDPASVTVALNGVGWPRERLIRAENRLATGPTEPYFLILGTREPRKNIRLVLELIEDFPDLLEHFRFIFTGKIGWLEEEQPIGPAIQAQIAAGRVKFTGFLSDDDKCALIMGAEATIYPSFLEGFGLPILESLSLGTPCLASVSSSMPDIGGECCRYFDPYSVADLYGAVVDLQRTRPKRSAAFRQACLDRAARFTWDGMLDAILTPFEALLRDRAEAPPG